jgi:hypothetical protein
MFFFVLFLNIIFLAADKTFSYMYNLEFEFLVFSGLILITIVINHVFKSIFLEILIAYTIIFFLVRMVFLVNGDASNQFQIRGLTYENVEDSMHLLSFIYSSLVLAIIIVNPRIDRTNLIQSKESKLLHFVFTFVFLVLCIHFYLALNRGLGFSPEDKLGSASIIMTILNEDNLLFLFFVTLMITPYSILKKYWFYLVAIVPTYVLLSLYNGNKSGIFVLAIYFLLTMWAMKGVIFLSMKNIFQMGFLTVFAGFIFMVGTLTRMAKFNVVIGGTGTVNRYGYTDALKDIPTLLGFGQGSGAIKPGTLDGAIQFVSYRIGYFDSFVDFVSTKAYGQYVSIGHYFKAIVDKLTPGYDVFNTPFASRMFTYARSGTDLGSIYTSSNKNIMNSDQITGFAENYILFGYGALIPFILIMLIFGYLVKWFQHFSPIARGLFLTLMVHAYWKWIEGFGYDMLLVNEVTYRLIFFLIVICFVTKDISITPWKKVNSRQK